jgi:DinB superfamily
MNEGQEPKLAPPGAGLPPIELAIGRLLFALRLRTGDRSAFDAQFQREREGVRRLCHGLSPEAASRRVLIKRLRGLEDSSRHWSVWMTLDHLRIVHNSVGRVVQALTQGRSPEGQASTAAVKPTTGVTAAVVADYERSCDDLRSVFAAAPNLETEQRFVHPWFGALNAKGWHALAATHLRIHRRQIEQIIAGQRNPSPL